MHTLVIKTGTFMTQVTYLFKITQNPECQLSRSADEFERTQPQFWFQLDSRNLWRDALFSKSLQWKPLGPHGALATGRWKLSSDSVIKMGFLFGTLTVIPIIFKKRNYYHHASHWPSSSVLRLTNMRWPAKFYFTHWHQPIDHFIWQLLPFISHSYGRRVDFQCWRCSPS